MINVLIFFKAKSEHPINCHKLLRIKLNVRNMKFQSVALAVLKSGKKSR